MSFEQYSPSNVMVSFSALNITGFAEGTFVEVERDEDGFTTYVGALGDVCRTRNLNRLGKITVTLMATAPINTALAALAQIDEDDATEVYPIQVKDISGDMICYGAEAWVMKRPKIERAKESSTIQWVFVVAELKILEGGNTV